MKTSILRTSFLEALQERIREQEGQSKPQAITGIPEAKK